MTWDPCDRRKVDVFKGPGTTRRFGILVLVTLLSHSLLAQQAPDDSLKARWVFSASGYYYIVPGEQNTFTFIGSADHKNLHLEGRYNYEDRQTGSVFAGRRFDGGNAVQFEIVPMAGIVFGNTNGVAPGLELSIAYKKLDFYSETEYVVNFAGQENNFLYTWGEIAISPIAGLRTGIVYQKTHLYQTDVDVQRGFLASYTFRRITIGGFYFNPFSSADNFVVALLSIDL